MEDNVKQLRTDMDRYLREGQGNIQKVILLIWNHLDSNYVGGDVEVYEINKKTKESMPSQELGGKHKRVRAIIINVSISAFIKDIDTRCRHSYPVIPKSASTFNSIQCLSEAPQWKFPYLRFRLELFAG
jgi:hypothetical protein